MYADTTFILVNGGTELGRVTLPAVDVHHLALQAEAAGRLELDTWVGRLLGHCLEAPLAAPPVLAALSAAGAAGRHGPDRLPPLRGYPAEVVVHLQPGPGQRMAALLPGDRQALLERLTAQLRALACPELACVARAVRWHAAALAPHLVRLTGCRSRLDPPARLLAA